MWIFLQNAMLSIVDDKAHGASKTGRTKPAQKSRNLLVRGRLKGDIERVFPKAVVTESLNTDYRYRALVRRDDVSAAMAKEVDRIDYGNFKNGVAGNLRHTAYFGAWAAMEAAQHKAAGRTFRDSAFEGD